MHVASNKCIVKLIGGEGVCSLERNFELNALKCCFQASGTKEAISWVLSYFMIKN